jgi:hypothetical protein
MSLIAPSVSQGGDDCVIAQELAIEDVRKTITSQITSVYSNGILKEIYGVHQKSEEAEVYFSFEINGEKEIGSTSLVRFNSGKWFNADTGELVKK